MTPTAAVPHNPIFKGITIFTETYFTAKKGKFKILHCCAAATSKASRAVTDTCHVSLNVTLGKKGPYFRISLQPEKYMGAVK